MSRKIEFYCAQCPRETGPTVDVTPVGVAFGTEANARALFEFIGQHLDLEHDIAIGEVSQ